MTDHLHERFQHLQVSRDGDWGDVLTRAGRRRGRRRWVLAAAVMAIVALAAPTALALRSSVVDFFESEPAPKPVVLDFAQLDIGAPPGMETEVVAGQARKILERKGYDGRVFTLYAAPSKKGGFCSFLKGGGGGGCLPAYSVPISPELAIGTIGPDGVIRGGPVLVDGWVGLPDAESIELRYEDDQVDRQEITWVSRPIEAGFFLFDVEPAHWRDAHQPQELVVLGADGKALRTEPIRFRTGRLLPTIAGAPAQAILSDSRQVTSIRAHAGRLEAALWAGPTADGRTCYWLRAGGQNYAGRCLEKDPYRPFGLVRSQAGRIALLWGGALPQDIAVIQLRYEDGKHDLIRPAGGTVLWEIRPEHLVRGHRPDRIVARDSAGRAVGRQTLPTKMGRTPGSSARP